MHHTNLHKAIAEAAQQFALTVVQVVKEASLQELMALQEPSAAAKRKGPGRPAKTETAAAAPVKKARKKHAYPKCAYPGCGKTKWARGKGFCGDHFKEWEAKKIKSADHYQKKAGK